MKRLFILPALLALSLSANAQKQSYLAFGLGADIKNGLIGSAPTGNKPAFDGIAQLNVVGANVHIDLGYESFQKIKFGRMFGSIGYELPLYAYPFGEEIKTTFIPAVEFSMITRNVTEKYTYNGVNMSEDRKYGFLAIGLNIALQWQLTDDFAVQLASNVLPRPDLKYIYGTDRTVISNYFKILYTFNKD